MLQKKIACLVLCFCLALYGYSQPNGAAVNTKAKQALELAKTGYHKAKSNYAKSQKKSLVLRKYIDCTLHYADSIMKSTFLPPKSKYPVALSLYREVLKFDLRNQHAAQNRDLIISIYKSMGRPVPKS
jgi:hypothetical protein